MGAVKFILRLIGWVVTITLQMVVSYQIIYMLSVIFAEVDSTSRLGRLFLLFMIWLGYVVGISAVGLVAISWVWKGVRRLELQRLIGAAIGAFIPLFILLLIGYSLHVGDVGSFSYHLMTDNWQTLLAQTALYAGMLGFYIPGILKTNPALSPVE
jgi:hypothetical protein